MIDDTVPPSPPAAPRAARPPASTTPAVPAHVPSAAPAPGGVPAPAVAAVAAPAARAHVSFWGRLLDMIQAAFGHAHKAVNEAAGSEVVKTVRGPILEALARKYGPAPAASTGAQDKVTRLVRILESLVAACEAEWQAIEGRRSEWRQLSATAYRLTARKFEAMADELDEFLTELRGATGTAPGGATPPSVPVPPATGMTPPSVPVPPAATGMTPPKLPAVTLPEVYKPLQMPEIRGGFMGIGQPRVERLKSVYDYVINTAEQILEGLRGPHGSNQFAIRVAMAQMTELSQILRKACRKLESMV